MRGLFLFIMFSIVAILAIIITWVFYNVFKAKESVLFP